MKKISIITYHNSYNYGAALQAYATALILKALGYEAVLIDYYPKNLRDFGSLKTTFREAGYKEKNLLKRMILTAVRLPSHRKLRKVFDDFTYGNLPLTDTYPTREALINDPPEADIYCTGSDQVWNNYYTHKFDGTYFLDFAPEGYPRFALSSSFGKEIFNEEELSYIKENISKYDLVTVREDSAKEILKSIGIDDVAVIPDPTILTDPKGWESFAENPEINEPYILVYQLHGDGTSLEKAVRYGKKTGMKVIRINTFYHQIRPGCRNIILPDPHAFLGLFKNADCVFTDSFHGTVFSLLFEKKLAVELPHKFSDRILTLLKTAGAECFVLDSLEKWEETSNSADYKAITANIEKHRSDSVKMLKSRLKQLARQYAGK